MEAIISDALALVTAVASVVALVLARQIVREARVARAEANAAEQATERFRLVAVRQAAVDRDIAEYVRIIARVERVGAASRQALVLPALHRLSPPVRRPSRR